MGVIGFRRLRAVVRCDRRRDAVPRVRIPSAGPSRGRVRDGSAGEHSVWTGAPWQRKRKYFGDRQYDDLGIRAGLRVFAYGSAVAVDRVALRLELRAALVRGQPQRVYNGGDRIRPGVENGRPVERRWLRAGRQPADDGDRGGAVLCIAARGFAVAADGSRRRSEVGMAGISPKVLAAFVAVSSLHADTKKLAYDQHVELVRGLTAEFAIVKAVLPRSRKPLEFESTGVWNRKQWEEVARRDGLAAKTGDTVKVTHVDVGEKSITLQINDGMQKKGSFFDR